MINNIQDGDNMCMYIVQYMINNIQEGDDMCMYTVHDK